MSYTQLRLENPFAAESYATMAAKARKEAFLQLDASSSERIALRGAVKKGTWADATSHVLHENSCTALSPFWGKHCLKTSFCHIALHDPSITCRSALSYAAVSASPGQLPDSQSIS